jgi:predicted NAD/FAD-binding protein
MRDYPAAALIRFCDNHGLLSLRGRPQWRSVTGGSREYVRRLTASVAAGLRLERPVHSVRRRDDHVLLADRAGAVRRFDHVVIATHADEALALLSDPGAEETATLGAFRYQANEAVLHRDAALMPRRRRVWSSWNYLGRSGGDGRGPSVTYWLNRLHALASPAPLFVTLNPGRAPRADAVLGNFRYEHPLYDIAAMRAQRALWSLQGRRNTWFCGAYFGAGFHEDGLQAGLAVAEALGGVRRPWQVDDESGRIHVGAPPPSISGRPTAAAQAR